MQKMIIRMYPRLTLKASPLNSRGSVRPTDRVRVVTSTLKGYGFLLGQANKFERASVLGRSSSAGLLPKGRKNGGRPTHGRLSYQNREATPLGSMFLLSFYPQVVPTHGY